MSSRVRRERTSAVRCVSGGPGVLAALMAQRLDVAHVVFDGDLEPADLGGSPTSRKQKTANASPQGSVWVHVAHEPADGLRPPSERASATVAMQSALRCARDAGVVRLVVVSSAMVHGAQAGRAGLLDEAASLGHVRDGSVADDLLDVEEVIASAPTDDLRVVVLRPGAVVGPGIDSPFVRQIHAPGVLSVRGEPLRWQLCHVDDLVSAVGLAAQGRLDDVGSAAVTPPGWLDVVDLTALTRRRRVELPASVVFSAAERLQQVGVATGALGALRFVVLPWAVDARRLAAVGWQPQVSHQQALVEQLRADDPAGGRGPGRREAWGAAGAAGVTIAALGTAALLRRGREQRLR